MVETCIHCGTDLNMQDTDTDSVCSGLNIFCKPCFERIAGSGDNKESNESLMAVVAMLKNEMANKDTFIEHLNKRVIKMENIHEGLHIHKK